MQILQLGKYGPIVSNIGLGCMGMSEFYGPADEADGIRVIHHALDLGVTLLDTADVYGLGRNEQLVGKAIHGRRDQAILASKFGIVRNKDGLIRGINGHPDYVHQACDASLKRLGLDTIDLYYQHRVDAKVPIEDTIGAMVELKQAGKIRYIGMSEAAPDTLRRASRVHPIAALQTEYSLWSRDPEDDLFATCRELGIGFVAYSPLSRGFLTGQIRGIDDLAPDDWRRHSPRFIGENFTRNLQLVEEVKAIATKRNCTPAQIAIAWVHNRDKTIVPIPGTRRIERLEENIAAMEMELSPEEMEQLERISPPGIAAGNRYPDVGMRFINV